MKWNAFDLLGSAFEKTKKRVLPFKFKEWLKLGVISALGSNTGSSGSFNSGGGSGGGSNHSSSAGISNSTINYSEAINNAFQRYWAPAAAIISVGILIMMLWSYILSVFNFIFIDSVLSKESHFTFGKNSSKGASLFWFRFMISLISIIGIVILAAPIIYALIIGAKLSPALWISYAVLAVILLIIFLLVLWFATLFVNDFVVAFMYSKNLPAYFSWRQIWRTIKSNKKETFVYWIARLIMAIAIGLASLLILLAVLLIFAIIAVLFWFAGLVLYKLAGLALFWIILGIILLVSLSMLFILSLMMLTMPLKVFFKYFELLNFEKLTGIKILK